MSDTFFTKPPHWEWFVIVYFFVGGILKYFGSNIGTKTLTATAAMREEAASDACPPGT